MLRKNAWIVAAATIMGGGVAMYLVQKESPRYQAGAVIRLDNTSRAVVGGLAGLEQNVGTGGDGLLSQLEVMRSRRIAEAVVANAPLRLKSLTEGFSVGTISGVTVAADFPADTVDLRFTAQGVELIDDAATVRAAYGETLQLPGLQFTVTSRPRVDAAELVVLPARQAVAAALRNVSAIPRERTNVVDVEFVWSDPLVAMQGANAFAEAFQAENANTAQQQSRRRRLFVEQQLSLTDSVFDAAQRALTQFRSSRRIYSSRELLVGQQQGMMGLDVRREELMADRRMFESLLKRLEDSDVDRRDDAIRTLVSAPGIAANPIVAQLFNSLTQNAVRRDSLTTGTWGVSPDHPDVKRLETLAVSIEQQLVSAVNSHLLALDARIAALDGLHARNAAQFQTLPATEAEEMLLVRDVETSGQMAAALREELQRARIAEAVEAGQVQVVDLAVEPGFRVPAGKPRKVLLGLLMGLLVGSGGAVLRERMNTSIRQKDDVEASLQVPVLGVIPPIGPDDRSRRRLARSNGKINGGNPAGDTRDLVTISAVRTPGAEAYRTLRTNLLFSDGLRSIRAIVVTSASPGEGKTTTVANLAVTYAQQGMKVLLIDCDLRKPRLHELFHIQSESGLTHLLMNKGSLEESVCRCGTDNLYVLPAGRLPPNPAEFVGGDRMGQLLALAQEQFEIVLIDSPPLLPASDAAILGAQVDAVLLVVKAGATHRGAAQYAVEQLANVGARLVGAVLNDPDNQIPQYGGYYSSYEYYGADSEAHV